MKDLLAKGMNKAQKVCRCKVVKSYHSQSFCSNIGECSQALLGGCSAGGLTTILHCDNFRSLLPASATVKCFSDAGYFIDA